MFGLFSVEVVCIDLVWEGVFFRDTETDDGLEIMESCAISIEKGSKTDNIYGTFQDTECNVAFFDSESSIQEILGKRGKIVLIKGHEWTQGSLGIWMADDKKQHIYIAM